MLTYGSIYTMKFNLQVLFLGLILMYIANLVIMFRCSNLYLYIDLISSNYWAA